MNKTTNGTGSENGNENGTHSVIQPLPKKSVPRQSAVPLQAFNEGVVTFRTSEGVKLTGIPTHFTRHNVFFELYNPEVMLRLSEVLGSYEIIFQSQTIYSGRAILHNVVNTGSKIVCEATLREDDWLDLNLAMPSRSGGDVSCQFKKFLKEWQKFYKVLPEFKISVVDIQTLLSDLRLWLDQVEMSIRDLPLTVRIELGREIIQNLQPSITAAIHELTERFEEVLNYVDLDLVPVHQAFCRRLLHPFTLCSPFMHRSFQKPLGYAGDYEMVDMMFRDPFEGGSLFAKMLNAYALQLPPIIGHRNRIRYLSDKVEEESLRGAIGNHGSRVFSMGCGPAREVQQLLGANELVNHMHFTLVDFDAETLEHTNCALNDLKKLHQCRVEIQTIKKSVFQIIKEYDRNRVYPQSLQYNLVYCAGLFDYLPDQICRKLVEIFHAMLLPNGLLIATNVDNHPAKNQMECFLDWHLVYRNADKMQSLAPQKVDPQNVTIKSDLSGVNVFMEIRKSDSEKRPAQQR